jgi:hypothetical protein
MFFMGFSGLCFDRWRDKPVAMGGLTVEEDFFAFLRRSTFFRRWESHAQRGFTPLPEWVSLDGWIKIVKKFV